MLTGSQLQGVNQMFCKCGAVVIIKNISPWVWKQVCGKTYQSPKTCNGIFQGNKGSRVFKRTIKVNQNG